MVHTEHVRNLFQMMSNLEEVLPYDPLICCAIKEVQQLQRTDCPESASHALTFLAASLANLYYQEVQAAQEQTACTYAGTIAKQTDHTAQLKAAQHLVAHYRQMCSPFLNDTDFCFWSVGNIRKEHNKHDTDSTQSNETNAAINSDRSLYSI